MIKKKDIKIAPSLLSGDFGALANEAKRAVAAGADCLHLDVMDGHFVPNLAMGPQAVAAINRSVDIFLDVHLMVYNPYDFVERFVEAGADRLTIHFEATEDVEETLRYIRRCNVEAGLAFCPETSMEFVPRFLNQCDLILLMTVHPGFGGQAFIPEVLDKIRYVREACDRLNIRDKGVLASSEKNKEEIPPFNIQVDGGINAETGRQTVEAGANVLVAGHYLFEEIEMAKGIEKLRACGE